MKKVLALMLVTSFFLFCGCSLKITKLDSRPNIALPNSTQTIKFSLGSRIENNFEMTSDSGMVRGIFIEDWQGMLRTGFQNGFSDYFQVKSDEDTTELTLKILDATPIITTTVAGTTRIEIKFKAQLLDQNNQILDNCAETAVPQTSLLGVGMASKTQLENNVKSAIESMYEFLAQKFFSEK